MRRRIRWRLQRIREWMFWHDMPWPKRCHMCASMCPAEWWAMCDCNGAPLELPADHPWGSCPRCAPPADWPTLELGDAADPW